MDGSGVEAWVAAGPDGQHVSLWLVRPSPGDEDHVLRQVEADAAALRAARLPGAPREVVRLDAGVGVVFPVDDGATVRVDQLQQGLAVLDERLPARAALELAAQVADGLRAAHTVEVDDEPRPVVHGDLRPGVVRVTRVGGVRLVGFGLSRITRRPRPRAATSGLVPGEAWRAPEAVLTADERPSTDVFSAALLAAEWIARRPLGPAPGSADLHDAWVEGVVGAASERCGPGADALRRALARRPDERPSAAELANALDEAARLLPGEGLAAFLGRTLPRVSALPTPLNPATGELRELRGAPPAPVPRPPGPIAWVSWVVGLTALAAASATCGAGSLLTVTAVDRWLHPPPAGVAVVEVPGATRVSVSCGGRRVVADGDRLELDAVGRGQCDASARVGDRTFASPVPIGPGVHVRCAVRAGGIDCRTVREPASMPEPSHGS